MRISLTPETDTNSVGDDHEVIATIKDENDSPQSGILVTFTVLSGPNKNDTGTDTTDSNGEATFTYTGDGGVGTDVIVACYTNDDNQEICSQTVTKVWNPAETSITITLTPPTALNLVGETHTLTATVTGVSTGTTVTFTAISGPNAGVIDTDDTDGSGKATVTYTGDGGVGTDRIEACVGTGQDKVCSSVVEKEWTEEVISLDPLLAENNLGEEHTVTATVQDLKGNKLDGYVVTFTVVSGPNKDDTDTDTTDTNGEATFKYTGNTEGTDVIQACFTNAASEEVCTDYDGRVGEDAIKEWKDGDDPCPAIEPNPDELSDAVKGESYSQQLTGFGGESPYTFSSSDLPSWLTLSTGGLLSGTPNTEGSYTFTIEVTDKNECTGEREYTLHVCPGITLSPSTSALPNGQVGVPYNQSITASESGVAYSMTGYLPPGLDWKEGSFIIHGTPTQTGTWEFTVIAKTQEPNVCTATGTYTITIRSAEPIPTVTEWGMIILALVLATISIVAIRRRRMMP